MNQAPTRSSDSLECPKCRRRLPPDSPGRLCPYCLLDAKPSGTLEAGWTAAGTYDRRFDLPAPEQLQPYFPSLVVESFIGHGGMGAVYRARQESLGRDVALKVLPPEIAASPGFTDRFVREAQALARLSHPNVVTVFEHGTAGPYAFLLMELVEGVDLRKLMEGRRMPPDEALRIVGQLCDALQYAHGRGVIHRDIKPENVLVDETGLVKITDFGLAKLATLGEGAPATHTRHVMGTVHYMAPEQIEHPRDVDHRADLYSLGVVFYELLTGELPLGRFQLPSAKAGTEKRYDRVVMRSLEKERDRRYSSASEVRSDLDRGPDTDQSVGEIEPAAGRWGAADGGGALSDGSGFFGGLAEFGATALVVAYYLLLWFWLVMLADGPDRDLPWTLGIGAAVAWGSARLVKHVLTITPLPKRLSGMATPIGWIARLPRLAYERLSVATRMIDGARPEFILAAQLALAGALLCFWAFVVGDDDFLLYLTLLLIAAWVLTRLGIPDPLASRSLAVRCLVYPPILAAVIPLTALFLLWPVAVWFVVFQTAPELFRWFVGIPLTDAPLTVTDSFDRLRVSVASCAAVETLWLTLIATGVAVSPEAARWWLRPLLDRWDGQGRILLLAGTFALFTLSASIWSLGV